MRTVSIKTGPDMLTYAIDGDTFVGTEEVLLHGDDNVVAGAPWEPEGYTIANFLTPGEFNILAEDLRKRVHRAVEKFAPVCTVPLSSFSLAQYHRTISNDENHLAVAMGTREGFPASELPIPIAEFERRISAVCRCDLSVINPRMDDANFYIRIVRPSAKGDNNPPHRDVWLDRLRDGVNLYLPIEGSNERSSLPIVPASHHWKESEIERTASGTKVDGATYRVPAVTGASQEFAMIRPNPRPGQMMLFSPYLIHGGGANFNLDVTRISVEMRFFRRS